MLNAGSDGLPQATILARQILQVNLYAARYKGYYRSCACPSLVSNILLQILLSSPASSSALAMALASMTFPYMPSTVDGSPLTAHKLESLLECRKSVGFAQVGTAVSMPRSTTLKPCTGAGTHSSGTSAAASRHVVGVSATAVEELSSADPDADRQHQLARVWRKIQGEDDWENLLEDPMDPILRQELLKYGDFVQICYDSFDFDKHSIYCGSCKYHWTTLFEQMNKADCGYEITKYLYATTSLDMPKCFCKSEREMESRWSNDSNWIGYVAVATDEEVKRLGRRDIVVAWRGTVTGVEWIEDIRTRQTVAGLEKGFPDVKVEEGFLDLYTANKDRSRFNKQSVREQVLQEVRRLLQRYEGEEVSLTITGHSLGAALALLNAYDVAARWSEESGGEGSRRMITVFSFAGPRVGNWFFRNRLAALGVRVLRVVNVHDRVPTVPGIIWNEKLPAWVATGRGYHHVGTLMSIDTSMSPMLMPKGGVGDYHNLEAQLHIIDCYNGPSLAFESATGRSLALVNKSCGFLRSDAYVPESWWQDQNKGLVRDDVGRWVVPTRQDIHIPKNSK